MIMNINDTMINEIKESSKKLVNDNIIFPVEMDYLLIEQAMLCGASIILESILKEELDEIELQKNRIDKEKLNNNRKLIQ